MIALAKEMGKLCSGLRVQDSLLWEEQEDDGAAIDEANGEDNGSDR